jgi:hypothetical protein
VDRAAVEEDAWIEDVPGMAEDFLAPPPAAGWESILLLNASDLATGCKVVFTRLDLADDRGMSPGCTTTPLTSGDRISSLAAGSVEASRYLAREADCSAPEGEPVTPGSVSIASAALASARFPYVSPTGRMLLCDPQTGEIAEELYVGDGGYIENTGIHTLLGLWTDLQPLVEEKNEIANGPVIVPIAVVVDNHYRSLARSQPAGQRSELTAPAFADRRVLIGAEALEQQLAAAFSGPVPGRAREADMSMAPADALRWFVVAPTTRPQIAAPLGWSLSDAARESLASQLDPALLDPVSECGPKGGGDEALCILADWLRGAPPRTLN